jgi:hypothetical protein
MATIKYWNGSAWELAIVGKQGPAGPTGPSAVTTKGDIATYSTTPTRLAVGNNGDTLLADSSTSTGLRWQSPVNANPILNSAFQVWQRGTSVATSVSSVKNYTADQWNLFRGGLASGATVSRQVTNDTTNLPFIQYCARVQRDSGNTSTAIINLYQSLETLNSVQFAGRTVTMSFYARAGANYSNASSNLAWGLNTGTGTDQNGANNGFTGVATPINQTATLTTTWQRFSASGTLATNTTQVGFSFTFSPTGTAGAADFFEITGVQLEVGSVATPFKTNGGTLQGELAACQRYYWRTPSSEVYSTYNAFGLFPTTTAWQGIFVHPIQMRVKASSIDFATPLNAFDGVNQFALTNLAITSNQSTPNGTYVSGTVSGATAFRPAFVINNNNAASFIGFSAEL